MTPFAHSLRQALATAICGGIGGASLFEAIASAWLHPATTVAQPTVAPVALAGGALGVAAALLGRRCVRCHPFAPHETPTHATDAVLFLDGAPLAPMAWQPVPCSAPHLDCHEEIERAPATHAATACAGLRARNRPCAARRHRARALRRTAAHR